MYGQTVSLFCRKWEASASSDCQKVRDDQGCPQTHDTTHTRSACIARREAEDSPQRCTLLKPHAKEGAYKERALRALDPSRPQKQFQQTSFWRWRGGCASLFSASSGRGQPPWCAMSRYIGRDPAHDGVYAFPSLYTRVRPECATLRDLYTCHQKHG